LFDAVVASVLSDSVIDSVASGRGALTCGDIDDSDP
jgi:hypothetical protein